MKTSDKIIIDVLKESLKDPSLKRQIVLELLQELTSQKSAPPDPSPLPIKKKIGLAPTISGFGSCGTGGCGSGIPASSCGYRGCH